MLRKRITALMLIVVMCCLPILSSACSQSTQENEKGSDDGDKNISAEENEVSEEDLKEQYKPDFGVVDMGGYVFKIGTRDDATHIYPAHTRDLYAEAETGDIINDAVYKRNRTIEDKYNCVIEMLDYPEADETAANNIVAKSVKAGDYSFDLLMTHIIHGASASANGYYHNIAMFPNIDLSKPYWNQGATDGLSVGGKLYIGLSDLSFSTNENLYCIFFNKQLMRDFEIADPYALVKENKWTFDKFNEIIRTGTLDVDGDGAMTEADQYGYVTSNSINFLWSGGSQIMSKDSDDMPYLDFMSEKTLAIFDKAFDITNNDYTFKDKEWFVETGIKIFENGRGLFYTSQLCRVNDLRATEFDFGIVPYPKFDSAQENYYSYVDGHASVMAIPQCLPNPEYTGMIIEELSYESYKNILPVYYDVVLNVKMVRDEESVDMLEILFDSKTFDFGYAYGSWDLWYLFLECIHNNDRDFVSKYEKKVDAALKTIDKMVTSIVDLE